MDNLFTHTKTPTPGLLEETNMFKYRNVLGSQVPSDLYYIDFRERLGLYEIDAPPVTQDLVSEQFFKCVMKKENLNYASYYGVWDMWTVYNEEQINHMFSGELNQYGCTFESFDKVDLLQATLTAFRWINICEGEANMKTHYTQEVTSNPVGGVVETKTTEQPGQESSVEISQNSKGEPRVSIKIYDSDPHEAASKAVSIYYSTLAAIKDKKESKHG